MRIFTVAQILGDFEIEIKALGKYAALSAFAFHGSEVIADGAVVRGGVRERLAGQMKSQFRRNRAAGRFDFPP